MSLPLELPPSPLIRDVAVRLDANVPSRIIDLGCNTGRNSIYLAKLGHDVLGLTDKLEDAGQAAEVAKSYSLQGSCHFVVGDIRHLPVGKPFDVVLMNEVLHQITKPQAQKVISSVQAHTRQGGLNIVSGYVVDPERANGTNRAHCFAPYELEAHYRMPGWQILAYAEDDHSEQIISRKQIISSLAMVVAQRTW